jgi:hypothetical protein
MRRVAFLASALVALCAPAAAVASSGNGLYQPFPAAVSSGPAISYYTQLHVSLSAAELRRGHFAGALGRLHSNEPSERAAAGPVALGASELAAVGALGLIAAAFAAARARARRPPARAS